MNSKLDMKPSEDLLHWLLSEVVSSFCPVSVRPGGATYSGARPLDIGERDFLEVYQHIIWLGHLGFAEVKDLGIMYGEVPSGALIQCLTMEGHDLLNKLQNS